MSLADMLYMEGRRRPRCRDRGLPLKQQPLGGGQDITIKRPKTGWRVGRITTHPGVILRQDFLLPMGITANQLALRTRMPATRVGEILHGRRAVSTDTALRLARYFGTSPEFWLNLQAAHDLSKTRLDLEKTIERDVQPLKAMASAAGI
jgi:addiction module HigA family antidote